MRMKSITMNMRRSILLLCIADIIGLSLANVGEVCHEPANLLDLYKTQRENDLSRLPQTGGYAETNPGALITRLVPPGHRRRRPRDDTVCECAVKDEVNYDPERLPKMMSQSSCAHNRRWYDRHHRWSAQCEEVYQTVSVKRRDGCVNGVYQYVPAVESIPVECGCKIYRRVVAARN